MQKNVSYLVVAAMIISAALIMSCDKNDKHPDDKCICILTDINGQFIGNKDISWEILEALDFMMYPNPTSDLVFLTFKTADSHIVSITDKNEKVLFKQSFDIQTQTIAINVIDYSAGEYQVSVSNGKHKNTLCLIKAN